jgi:hypothetical protein
VNIPDGHFPGLMEGEAIREAAKRETGNEENINAVLHEITLV